MRRVILIILSLVGVALFGLGATWTFWHSPHLFWTPQQATEHAEAWRALKIASTSGMRRADPKADPKLAAAQERYDKSSAQLARATTLNQSGGSAMVVAGVILIAIAAWLGLSTGRQGTD